MEKKADDFVVSWSLRLVLRDDGSFVYRLAQAHGIVGHVQNQLGETQQAYDSLQRRFNELDSSVAGLNSETSDYLARIAELEMGPLPVEVESALERLARTHPDLLAFDAERGMIRFSSDFVSV